ncbi:MAG: LysM peptidoglycan-binding domain-containing protein [Candidatus Shapirobacteria bacterium]|jgi:nucleoid-associated protein YgaU
MMKKAEKVFRNKEDIISMFLGLVVVVVLALILVNFIEKRKGNVEVPGISDQLKIEETKNLGNNENNVGNVVVQKNDSLWKIAVKTYNDGYKWTEIAKANNLKNPGILYVGQKLVLPRIEKTVATTEIEENITVVNQNSEYTVVRGDSLWKIAIKVYGDGYKWTEIWQSNRNKLNSPDKLEIGMKLLIYGKI